MKITKMNNPKKITDISGQAGTGSKVVNWTIFSKLKEKEI